MTLPVDLEMNTPSTHLRAKDSLFGTERKTICSTDALPDKNCPATDPGLQTDEPPKASANTETALWRPKTFRETMDLLLSSLAERDELPPPSVTYTEENETTWSHDTSSDLSSCWSQSLGDSSSSVTSVDLDRTTVHQDKEASKWTKTDDTHPRPDKEELNGNSFSANGTGCLCDEANIKEKQKCEEIEKRNILPEAEARNDAKILEILSREIVNTETKSMETVELTELLHESQDFVNDYDSYRISEETSVTGAQLFVDLEESRQDNVEDVDASIVTSCDDSTSSIAEESAASSRSAPPVASTPAPLPAHIHQPEYLKYYLTVCYNSTSHKTQGDCRAEGYRCCRGRPLRVTLDRYSLSNQPGYLVVREEEEEAPLPRACVSQGTPKTVQTSQAPVDPEYLPFRFTQCYRSSRHKTQRDCFYDRYQCCRGNPLRVTVNRHSISQLPGYYVLRTEDLSEEQWNRLFHYKAPDRAERRPSYHRNNKWHLSHYDGHNVADHYYSDYDYRNNNEYSWNGYYHRSLWSWQQPAVEWKSPKGVVTGVMKQGLTAVSPPPRSPVPFDERPVKASAPPGKDQWTWSAHEEFAHAIKSKGQRIVPKSNKSYGLQKTRHRLETLFEKEFEESDLS